QERTGACVFDFQRPLAAALNKPGKCVQHRKGVLRRGLFGLLQGFEYFVGGFGVGHFELWFVGWVERPVHRGSISEKRKRYPSSCVREKGRWVSQGLNPSYG